jgi:hypothetical protein
MVSLWKQAKDESFNLDKENQSSTMSGSPLYKRQKQECTPQRTIDEKLHDIFLVIDKA